MTMISRLQARYQGKRYSFGYPACPALEAERREQARDDVTSFQRPQGKARGKRVASNQASIWELLKPEDIGVSMTEGFMMEPEASVSVLVFHHPDCIYFGVGDVESS